MMSVKLHLFLILIIAIVGISSSAIWIRLALDSSSTEGVGFSLVIAGLRLTLATLILFVTPQPKSSLKLPLSVIFLSLLSGVMLAGHFATWITSLSYTSITASTTLVTTTPLWVILFSWLFFREKPHPKTLIGIIIAITGSVCLTVFDEPSSRIILGHSIWGNSLALIGAVFASLYLLLGKEIQKKQCSLSQYVRLAYGSSALCLLPLPFLFKTSYQGYSLSVYGYILGLAIFSQVIGHTCFNWSMKYLSPLQVSLIILTEPVGASLLGIIFFQEIPSPRVIMSALVIVVGVVIAQKY